MMEYRTTYRRRLDLRRKKAVRRSKKSLGLGSWSAILFLTWATLLMAEKQFKAALRPALIGVAVAVVTRLCRRRGVSA